MATRYEGDNKTRRQVVDGLLKEGFRPDLKRDCFSKQEEDGVVTATVFDWPPGYGVWFDLLEGETV